MKGLDGVVAIHILTSASVSPGTLDGEQLPGRYHRDAIGIGKLPIFTVYRGKIFFTDLPFTEKNSAVKRKPAKMVAQVGLNVNWK